MRCSFHLLRIALCLMGAAAWPGLSPAASLRAVPTYENAGISVETAGNAPLDPASLKILYRAKGSARWIEAHALTSSATDPAPRGSLFGLSPHTRYEVRCEGGDGQFLAGTEFETWSDSPPIAQTINIRDLTPDGSPVVIDKSGSPEGWVRYAADPGFVIDGGQLADETILVKDAHHIILDGLTVRGGRRHGIRLEKSRDIRITNCDISGFGRIGVQDLARGGKFYMPGEAKPVNWDAGVFIDLSGNVTIERSYIHDPRGHANSWFFSHPEGPNAIYVRSTGGIVVRYNDLVASEAHRWNDVIESHGNGNVDGGFNHDSDIYGNFLAFPNDDGIEIDGGQCNVRLYGNKIEGGLCGISTASNRRGPSYIFGNLVVNLGDERGAASAAVKNGGGTTYSQGTTYFYHNTFLTFGRGIAAVGYGKDADRGMFLAHARNNIFATGGLGIDDTIPSPRKSYDHDVFSGAMGGGGEYDIEGEGEAHGIVADAGFIDAPRGALATAPDSAARREGERVPGLSAFQPASGPVAAGLWFGAAPLRPVAASLDHTQLFLTADGTDTPVRQKTTLTSSAAPGTEPRPFRILKNDASSWLRVQPSSGTLKPGESIPLSVEFDPADRIGRGLLLGAAIVKFDDGLSLPLSVYAIAPASPLRHLYEAESLTGSDSFPRLTDTAASGGSALHFADDAAGISGKGARSLQITLDMPVAGACYLAFRTRSPRPYGQHDSIFVSLNGGKPVQCALTGTGQWGWSRLTGQTAHIDLPAGPNRITLIPRESLDLDAILASDRPLMAGDRLADLIGTHPPLTTPHPQ